MALLTSTPTPLAFSEFGTRRRRSFKAHDVVLQGLIQGQKEWREKGGQGVGLAGTSNVSRLCGSIFLSAAAELTSRCISRSSTVYPLRALSRTSGSWLLAQSMGMRGQMGGLWTCGNKVCYVSADSSL